MMFEVGRVCLKIAGREAGRYCVIVNRIDDNFVTVTGPRNLTDVKRRRCNVNHLEPILDVLKIKADATDEGVLKAYQEANLMKKLNLEVRKRHESKAKGEKKAQKKGKKEGKDSKDSRKKVKKK
jgi:large subunit ribosomal protein L14e